MGPNKLRRHRLQPLPLDVSYTNRKKPRGSRGVSRHRKSLPRVSLTRKRKRLRPPLRHTMSDMQNSKPDMLKLCVHLKPFGHRPLHRSRKLKRPSERQPSV